MSLRTKVILFNTCVLAVALLGAAIAALGFGASVGPLRQAIAGESRAMEQAETVLGRLAESAGQTPGLADDEAIAAAHRLAQEERAAQAADSLAAQTAATAAVAFLGLLTLGLAGCALLSLSFSRSLLHRVTSLAVATGRVAAGDRAVALNAPPGGDELDQLTHAFDEMVRQLAEAERAAQAADALKTGFLASISHDLRTPLTTVRGLLETLARDDPERDAPQRAASQRAASQRAASQRQAARDREARTELLGVALRETDRLTRLVTNLLDLTRLEAGAWPFEPEELDVAAIVSSLVADLQLPGGVLNGRDVSVTTFPGAPGLPSVPSASSAPGASSVPGAPRALAWGDETQVRRVLENLLSNAAKFSPAGSPIRVDVTGSATGAHGETGSPAIVQVAVADAGPGIAPEDAAHVFERFYRARQRGQGVDPPPGTGLGLAIARTIVQAHGGAIWVEPSPLGGARFVFTLPAAGTRAPAGPPTPAGAPGPHSIQPDSNAPGAPDAPGASGTREAEAVSA